MRSKLLGLIIIGGAAAALSGCKPVAPSSSGPTSAKASAPASAATAPVDASTPDKAVKAVWAKMDAGNKAMCEAQRRVLAGPDGDAKLALMGSIASGMQGDLVTGGVVKAYNDGLARALNCTPEVYVREIEEAKVETDSRATVTATIKNITPIPPNADESDYLTEERKKGTRYKYELTKSGNSWKVEDVFYWGEYTKEFESMYSDPRAPYPYSAPPL